jgi:DNA invertase Pin-like site-specific DNA recombinase
MIYGYARVSTDGQGVDAQVKQLRAAGAEKVFRETAGGAQTDRTQLRHVLAQIGKGDVLIVTRLIHMARSMPDLLNTLGAITDKGAGFRSLGDTWADTTTARGCLMLTVLGGLGEFERELSRRRTSEGRARGRPLKLTTHERKEAIMRRDRGEETLVEIGRSYNVNASTISRLMP